MRELDYQFVNRYDIPKNGILFTQCWNDTIINALYIVSRLYDNCINDLWGKPNKPLFEPDTEIPWKTVDEALDNFSPFHIMDNITELVQRKEKLFLFTYTEVSANPDHYIDQMGKAYLFNCRPRYCWTYNFIFEGFRGELGEMCNSLGIDLPAPNNYTHNLRQIGSLQKPISLKTWYSNTIQDLKNLHKNLAAILFTLQRKMVRMPVLSNCEIDL